MLSEEKINRVLEDTAFLDWSWRWISLKNGWLIQAQFYAADTDGNMQLQSGRKWYVSPYSTESELVQTMLKAVLTATEHEVREKFMYRGKAIFGPHFDVNCLAIMLPMEQIRDANNGGAAMDP